MENVNIVLAANILKYRKKCGFNQEELAQKLGVTFQAVSKWENAKAAPDIAFLPIMADIFGCCIDELFSREIQTEIHYDHCAEFPWPDDNTIRIFQTLGRKILKSKEDSPIMEVTFPPNCNETTRQYFKVEIFGNIFADSSINGDVVCHGDVDCHDVNGNVDCGGDIDCSEINGNVVAKGDIDCKEINGNIVAQGDINTREKINVLPGDDVPESMKKYLADQIKYQLDNNGSTNSFLEIMAENLSGNFELTDENIERLLEAYRDLYKGMRKKNGQ